MGGLMQNCSRFFLMARNTAKSCMGAAAAIAARGGGIVRHRRLFRLSGAKQPALKGYLSVTGTLKINRIKTAFFGAPTVVNGANLFADRENIIILPPKT